MKKFLGGLLLILVLGLVGCGYSDSSQEDLCFTIVLRESNTTTTVPEEKTTEETKFLNTPNNKSVPTVTTTIVTRPIETTETIVVTNLEFLDYHKTVYSTGLIKFYTEADLNSELNCFIQQNTELEVTDISSDKKWYKVLFNGIDGYVLISNTTLDKPVVITTTMPTTTTVATTTTKLTTTPIQTTTVSAPQQQFGAYRLPYILTDNDWYWVCKVVCSETGYCGERQQKAVANTIFNRILWAQEYGNYNPFPKDVYSILHQPAQYDAVNYWRSDVRLMPGGELWNNTMRIIKEAACEPDFTNGSIGYYNPQMCGYLSAFENNSALILAYIDGAGRFFKLNPYCYTQK